MDQVDLVMAEMLKDAKTASATHNIVGYRVQNPDTGKIEQVSCSALSGFRMLGQGVDSQSHRLTVPIPS